LGFHCHNYVEIVKVATGALYATPRKFNESKNMTTGLVIIAITYIVRLASSGALGVRETTFNFNPFDLTVRR
jgi:hypothetical protein